MHIQEIPTLSPVQDGPQDALSNRDQFATAFLAHKDSNKEQKTPIYSGRLISVNNSPMKSIRRSPSHSRILVGTPLRTSTNQLQTQHKIAVSGFHLPRNLSSDSTFSKESSSLLSLHQNHTETALPNANSPMEQFPQIPLSLSNSSFDKDDEDDLFSVLFDSTEHYHSTAKNETKTIDNLSREEEDDDSCDLQDLFNAFVNDDDEDFVDWMSAHQTRGSAIALNLADTLDAERKGDDAPSTLFSCRPPIPSKQQGDVSLHRYVPCGGEYAVHSPSPDIVTPSAASVVTGNAKNVDVNTMASTTHSPSPTPMHESQKKKTKVPVATTPDVSSQLNLSPLQYTYLFTKRLTQSDVSRLHRIILPRQSAEQYFPPCPKDGLSLTIYGHGLREYPCVFKFWSNGPKSSQQKMYLLDVDKRQPTLFDDLQLKAGSLLDFYLDFQGRYVVDTRN